MIPNREILAIYQGDTLKASYQLRDSDGNTITLPGFVGTSEIRKGITGTLIENPTVTIDEDNGIFTLGLTATETAALSQTEDWMWFDVHLTKSGEVYTPISGPCVIYPKVKAAS